MELLPTFITIPYFGPQHWADRETNLPYMGKMFIHLLQKKDVNKSVCNVCTHVQYSPNSSSSILSQYMVIIAWDYFSSLKFSLNICS